MFIAMLNIRHLNPHDLAQKLYELLNKEQETFNSNDRLRMHQQNRYAIHRILARITDYVETQSGEPSRYSNYVATVGKNRYEIEHIWADHYEDHEDEFEHPNDFDEYRNRIGGLLLLPKRFNASYGDLPYEKKISHYYSQNLLARSLHPKCYEHNPGFLRFIEESKLPFKHHEHFKKVNLDERSDLYREIAGHIWNPEDIKREI